MELKLIEVARRKFTRVKIRTKDWDIDSLSKALGDKPIKQSSQFTYWEVEGDLDDTRNKLLRGEE